MNPAYRPMLATLVDAPFDDQRWVFETKWDGFRLITEKRDHAVRLWSRNGIDVTTRYAMLLPALQKIDGSCVIDGELCALDAHGRSRFQLLQNALNKKAKLLYVVFDALFVGGKDIREKPLLERKKILKAVMPRDPLLRYSEYVAEFGRRESRTTMKKMKFAPVGPEPASRNPGGPWSVDHSPSTRRLAYCRGGIGIRDGGGVGL